MVAAVDERTLGLRVEYRQRITKIARWVVQMKRIQRSDDQVNLAAQGGPDLRPL